MKRTTIGALLGLAAAAAWAGDEDRVTGRVLGPDGKGVKGVQVHVRVKAWPGDRFQSRDHVAKSGKKGRFHVNGALPAEGRYGVYVSAVVPGSTAAGRYIWRQEGGPLEPVDLVVHPAHKLRLRFVNAKGKPVDGVLAFPSMRADAAGTRHFLTLRDDGRVKSGKKGLVRMDHFLPGEWAGVHVQFPGRDWEERNFTVPEKKDAVVDVSQVAPETPDLDVRAGDDPKKRFFFRGPKAGDAEPAAGYGLLLVLPGGDGSADFRGFGSTIYQEWLDAGYVQAQLVAPRWNADQETIWPTEPDRKKVKGLEFTTEEFVEAVVTDVSDRVKVDPTRVFTLSWSSSGPACYRISSLKKTSVTGQLIVMSVFRRHEMEKLRNTKGRPFFILHSKTDATCAFNHAETARDALRKKGADVEFATYEGGHSWTEDAREKARTALRWLDEQTR